jgi:hypothetical protein
MIDFKNLIYLPIDVPNPPNIVKFLDTINDKDMIVDKYRTCHHIPIMDETGSYTSIGHELDELSEWLETYVFPWTAPTRVRVLKTLSQESNAPHIDCSPKKFLTVQHKFRYVFQGEVDTLTFMHDNKETTIPNIDKPYIIDGKWPHKMYNKSLLTKYTLVLGAPWEPNLSNKLYVNKLKESYEKFKDEYISAESWNLPVGWKGLFEKQYQSEMYVLDHISN